MSFREVERGFLPLVGCWFNFQIVNSLLINLHILLRYPTPKFYFLMGPHATPVGIKTRGQDDIIFKCTQIFHLFDKISGNSGSHILQPSLPINFQSLVIYASIISMIKKEFCSKLLYCYKFFEVWPVADIIISIAKSFYQKL